jgi:hypothetical protein
MQRDHHAVPVPNVAAHPLDLIGVDIGGVAISTVSGMFRINLASGVGWYTSITASQIRHSTG